MTDPQQPTPPTPSPTPLGTCDAHKGLLPHSGHDDICINWRPLPEPSPGTEKEKEMKCSVCGEPDHSGEWKHDAAEGLEPPPPDDDGMTPMPFTDGERQSMKEAFNREREWRIATEAENTKLRDVLEAAKAVYKHMTVDSAGVAPDEAKLIAALDRLEDNR